MTALYGELIVAFTLLTRLPLAWLGSTQTQNAFAGAVWAYPIVGIVVGAIGASVYIACIWLLSPSLAAILALGTTVLVTGGLHEDALADTADGFGGGRSHASKLEIMRDSRIGTFGVLALMFAFAARVAAITSITAPSQVVRALIIAGCLGRGAMIVPVMILMPARTDGLGARLVSVSWVRSVVGLLLTAAATVSLLPFSQALGTAATAGVVALAISVLARQQIGGHTGDVLGATEVMVECAVLAVLAASAAKSIG